MKQSYASAGKAPRRRVHSPSGIAAIAEFGLPPPRIVIGYLAHQTQSAAEPRLSFLVLECCSLEFAHAAGRNSTPSGTSPVVTRRHSAISSLRASATIIVVLRAPLGPSVRVRYHCASALSFWNIRKRHANWISPRRTRALPALAKPFSRRFKPLSSGDPVARRSAPPLFDLEASATRSPAPACPPSQCRYRSPWRAAAPSHAALYPVPDRAARHGSSRSS